MQTEVVKSLLAHKANPRAGAMDDMLPLHFAAQKGHTEICRLLVNEGALMNAGPARERERVCGCVRGLETGSRRTRTPWRCGRFAAVLVSQQRVVQSPGLGPGTQAPAGLLSLQWLLTSALELVGQPSRDSRRRNRNHIPALGVRSP
jgi:ankyrin repeat protein